MLALIYALNTGNPAGGTGAGQYPFQVAQPATGAVAPAFTLPATTGRMFDLHAQRGKTVLLFFQEGLSCEPCWTQIKDIETHQTQMAPLHIDEMISITSDPLTDLKQKVADEGISTPILSDANMAVSQTYHANEYGMMGTAKDGHTFILVGPDGVIRWRADYGGPPDYTMDVPVANLVADIQEGTRGTEFPHPGDRAHSGALWLL